MAPNLVKRTIDSLPQDEQKQKVDSGTNFFRETAENYNKSKSELVSNDNPSSYKMEIVWKNVLLLTVIHSLALYGFYLLFIGTYSFSAFLVNYIYGIFGGICVTTGAHRLWAHKTYSAKLPLRIILMIGHTIATQNDIYTWSRDHRGHHKFTDQDADPHNAKRGFFFSHIGWLLVKKHPDVISKGKTVDVSDLMEDPVVRFQRKYYMLLVLLLSFALPVWVTWQFFGQAFWYTLVGQFIRLTLSLHITWLVNSGAHAWGMRPYDKSIKPTDHKILAWFTMGEGWHNYHHVFPWDYKAAELGNYRYNMSTMFLDLAGKLGLAYDMKTASEDLIIKRALRTGDQTHWSALKKGEIGDIDTDHHHHEGALWGWGDKDMEEDDVVEIKKSCTILRQNG